MALAVTTTDPSLETVVGALLAHYPASTVAASAWSFRSSIVHVDVPSDGHVELIVPDDEPLAPLGFQVARLAADTTVTVVVASHRMGTAHRALRGSGAVVQPWWLDGETVCFGRAEHT